MRSYRFMSISFSSQSDKKVKNPPDLLDSFMGKRGKIGVGSAACVYCQGLQLLRYDTKKTDTFQRKQEWYAASDMR